MKSHTIEEARKIIEDSYKESQIKVEEAIKEAERKAAEEQAKELEQQSIDETMLERNQTQTDRVSVLDPDRAVTKGKDNKRSKGSYDSYKKPSKKGKQRHKEFGSKTPIVQKEHLF